VTPSAAGTHAPERVTLTFQTDSGRRYLYDDVTGGILPWNDAREAALTSAVAAASPDLAPSAAVDGGGGAAGFVNHWLARGAFLRRPPEYPPLPGDDATIDLVRQCAMQLVLIVTEQCNLRCRYCVFSGSYTYERPHGLTRLSVADACRAVDWFAELVAAQRAQHPGRQFALTFYGGEPLLNVPVIRATLEHAARRFPGWFRPGITSNGVQLTPQNVAMLVAHRVHLAVSLDGPASEHDRNRRDAGGMATHARIMKRLAFIRRRYPDYWRDYVSAACVFDYGTDLEAAAAFFDTDNGVPRPAFVNMASDLNTTHWRAAAPEDLRRLRAAAARLRARYKRALIEGTPIGGYDRLLGGGDIFQLTIRPRLNDVRTPYLPFSGTCFPGRKIAVGVSGALHLCERVNTTAPIGHLDRGIDPERVRSMVEEYQRTVLARCASCPATRLCSICFSHVLADDRFVDPAALCEGARRRAISSLRDYISIMEANPEADFSFESDTMQMERRWLFCS
jgi:uncharacterized protein